MFLVTLWFSSVAMAGPPTVTILEPTDQLVVSKGQSVVFSSTGSDPEDGVLEGSSLTWVSEGDGPIGEGTTLEVSLSAGSHLITLTVTDSQGTTDTAQITITVE